MGFWNVGQPHGKTALIVWTSAYSLALTDHSVRGLISDQNSPSNSYYVFIDCELMTTCYLFA